MADQYRKPYLDSAVFIALIKDETVQGVPRGQIARHIVALAAKKTFKLHTSALTLAEVYKLRSGPILLEEQSQRVLDYFEHDYIELIEVDRLVAEEANRFCRQYGLLPNDAIHLACALRAECDVLPTWDRDFKGVSFSGLSVEQPEIRGQSRFNPI